MSWPTLEIINGEFYVNGKKSTYKCPEQWIPKDEIEAGCYIYNGRQVWYAEGELWNNWANYVDCHSYHERIRTNHSRLVNMCDDAIRKGFTREQFKLLCEKYPDAKDILRIRGGINLD